MSSARAVAAVDLGSNSFHMVVARLSAGHVHVLDRLKERVALAAGLRKDGTLSDDAQERALDCLARFGQRLSEMPARSVRAVGTSALRQAKNSDEFLERAKAVLGHHIEVIPGREEARLIYLGVAHSRQDDAGRRFVVDIGGGSTECIIGRRFEPQLLDSLQMGCVNWSLRFFENGRITKKSMEKARLAARLEVRTIRSRYRRLGWSVAIGSSGTALAIEKILVANGWSARGITAKGLGRLRDAMLDAGRVDRLELAGMEPERADVLAGGVSIMTAVFEGLGVERMATSNGALREGVLFDLLGRFRHEDVRERTIERFAERYGVDQAQAARVERTAGKLLGQVAKAWELEDEETATILAWAAQLHEVGLAVAYSGHHRHGAYLVANSDMPGFSKGDQEMLAALILGHRRKVIGEMLQALPNPFATRAGRLCLILRLAVLLHRSRAERRAPALRLTAHGDRLVVRFPEGWLARHPMTHADLEEERVFLRDAGFELDVA